MPYPFITIPIAIVILTQIIKLSIDGVKGNLTLTHILSDYSGMPSSHSAFVASIATLTALSRGIDSPEFGIAFVFAVVVIRDALGFRRHLGDISARVNTLSDQKPPLKERIGHKPREVVVGTILGIVLSGILYII